MKKPSLPKVFGSLRSIVRDSIIKYKYNSKELSDEDLLGLGELGLLTDETKLLVKEKCNNIKVKTQLRNPHSLIMKHQEEMKLRKQKEKELKENSFRYNLIAGKDLKYTNFHSALPIHVSDSDTNRAYRIMDALIKTIEELEGRIYVEPYIGKDVANIHLGLHSYEFKLKEGLKGTRPKSKSLIISNEKVNILEISFHTKSSYGQDLSQNMKYEDANEIPLESQLSKILYDLFVIDNKLSVMEEIRSRELDRRWEEEKRQQRLEKMRNEEHERVAILEKVVTDWDKAQKIRCFSDRLEESMVGIIDASREKK